MVTITVVTKVSGSEKEAMAMMKVVMVVVRLIVMTMVCMHAANANPNNGRDDSYVRSNGRDVLTSTPLIGIPIGAFEFVHAFPESFQQRSFVFAHVSLPSCWG